MKQPRGKLSARRVSSAKSAGKATFLFLAVTSALRAAELPLPVTLNLPIPVNQATPAWLGHPDSPAAYLASLNLPILTPNNNASLLVTVYFEEKQGSYLRVIWKGTQGSQILSDNFYEDIGMSNQRSILLAPATLVGDGVLTFLSGDAKLGVTKIKLEWLEAKTGLVSPMVHDVTVTSGDGETHLSQDLTGQSAPTSQGMWQNQVVSVPLSDAAVRIEQGVDFSVDLDKLPSSARLSLKESGLPMGHHVVVWVNNLRAGIISPSVPDLLDDGFVSDDKGKTTYSGWRNGTFYVPVTLLKAGVNAVQFTAESDTANAIPDPFGSGISTPMAVKSMSMQLSYQPAGPKAGLTQPQFWKESSDPLAPVP